MTETRDEIVRIVPSGKEVGEDFLFDVQMPTVPAPGDRIELEWDGVLHVYLVVSRTFQIIMDSIERSETWGDRSGSVKTILHVDEIAVDAINLRHGKFAQKGEK